MNVGTIELGAQSMDDEVLKLSKRGHNSQQIKDASQLIIDNGFKLGLQMMIGLPGDSFERSLNTANEIVKYGADNTRIYPALVIKNTLMHKWYNEGKYIPLTLEEAVEWAGHILQIFEKNNVNVIRVGLHPSEGLLSGDEIIAGPFHQSFRELVLTNIWGGILNKIKQPHDKTKTIDIFVNKRELNYAIGHKQVNRKRLLKEFKNVFFKADNSIKLREAKIRVL
jgi:histone acetyltransferase (RNA polymerase elongator complex component)